METGHWIMFLIWAVAFYVAGRLFPQPAQWFGLP